MYEKMKPLDILNDLRARELAVIVQYMRHHYTAAGPEGLMLADEFKAASIDEMKHAEELAERIDFLGGDPTTKPEKIVSTSNKIKEMAAADFAAEEDAIARYKEAIAIFAGTDDVTTRKLLEDILGDEEDHLKTFGDMMGK